MDHPLQELDKRAIPTRMTVENWKKAWDDANETSSSLQGLKGVNAFYALPYRDELLIHHLLDPMHCFKNAAMVYGNTSVDKRQSK